MEQTASEVCLMAPSAESTRSERIITQLAGNPGLCVSPFCTNLTDFSQNPERGSRTGDGLPPLAITSMVPSPATTIDRFSTNFPAELSPHSFAHSGTTPAVTVQQILIIRLDVVRRRLKDKGLSDEVIKILLENNRTTTAATYQSSWKSWINWNNKRDSDPLFPSLNSILQFLTDSFNSGKSYSSLNIHRLMLSSTLEAVDDHKIGEHHLVVQLLKGCFNLNLPQPRYNIFWDPDVVLKHFDLLGENRNLSLTILSRKLAILLALSTVSRVSEI